MEKSKYKVNKIAAQALENIDQHFNSLDNTLSELRKINYEREQEREAYHSKHSPSDENVNFFSTGINW